MTNASDTIYCEFINSCILKKLKQTMGMKWRKQSSGKLLKVKLTTVTPRRGAVSANLLSPTDCLKETAETDRRKLHSDLSCNIPTTGSESLNSTLDFFNNFILILQRL